MDIGHHDILKKLLIFVFFWAFLQRDAFLHTADEEQLPLDEIALHEMLTVDGVEKAKDKAFERLKEKVLNSDIPLWKWAVKMIREAERN